MRWTAYLATVPVLVACFVAVENVHASVGDRSPAYRLCLGTCLNDVCSAKPQLPVTLRWTFWTCKDDCSYHCVHNLTNAAVDAKMPFDERVRALDGLPPRIVQYHGKWPFYRLMGIQEPFSVFFSLGNMYMHCRYGLTMARRLPTNFPKPLSDIYQILPLAGINLWFWSSIFHTRDKPWTEKLDYFSAALSMLCNLYLAIVRIGGIYTPPGQPKPQNHRSILRTALGCSLAIIFVCHVSYLTFGTFDYGYNMAFNVFIGLFHNALWYAWSAYHYFARISPKRMLVTTRPLSNDPHDSGLRAPHYWQPAAVLTLLSVAMAFELLDFAPIGRALDAHALWHASTIPIVKWWYDVLVRDAHWVCGESEPPGEYVRSGLSKRSRMA